MTDPALSPCGALVAKALKEANREAHREGAGQVWQPLASRQLDSWAATSLPAHALSVPVQSLQHIPALSHQVSHRHSQPCSRHNVCRACLQSMLDSRGVILLWIV